MRRYLSFSVSVLLTISIQNTSFGQARQTAASETPTTSQLRTSELRASELRASEQGLGFDPAKVFDEVAETVETHFFEQDFDVDAWRAKVETAKLSAQKSKTRDEFAEVINRLIATLNASHTHYYSRQDPRRYQLLGVFQHLYPADEVDQFSYEGIGIYTKTIDDSMYVSAVFDGLPAARAGLRFGDQILKVDGLPFHPVDSFRGKSGSEIVVVLSRSGTNLSVTVEVEKLDGRTMFETAMTASQKVIEDNGKKIGYIHIWSYAGPKYQEALKAAILFGDLSQCDSLVLDLREGWGGADSPFDRCRDKAKRAAIQASGENRWP